nr:L-seryl-tRNA(Sec) selenium transferase [Deltaproteobacteria bacterium]
INGTGIIVHTNLGRAPLPPFTMKSIVETAAYYSTLEFDIESGKRGSRNAHIEDLLREVCKCEAALSVNNNAAAMLLVLSALSRGRETVVSRGQLVEIGGSFRIPEILEQSGAILKEVGTTNKTRIGDYAAAITENTALFLMVHKSNFYMGGFVEEVSLEELCSLGKRYSIPVVYDWGSGSIFDLAPHGFPEERGVKFALECGADIVTFSGDKLFGGPQAGIIVGKGELIEVLKKHPLARALRIDKLSISALNSILIKYLDEEIAKRELPVLRMLLQNDLEIKKRATRVMKKARQEAEEKYIRFEIVEEEAECGGGALPGVKVKTWCLAIYSDRHSPDVMSRAFRLGDPPVIGRISGDRFLIDFRTVFPEEEKLLLASISLVFSGPT